MRAENVNSAEFGYAIDGSNRTFVVQNVPVVPAGFYRVVADNAVTTAFTATEAQGQLVMNVAPTNSLYVSYYFYLFPDAVYNEFVAAGLESINYEDASLNDAGDIVNVPPGLLVALKYYVCAFFYQRVASQTGLWYNQRLQERQEDRDPISTKYAKLADSTLKKADAAREAFYKGSGSDAAPSFRVGGYQPRPWTPTR